MGNACDHALLQIEERNYSDELIRDGYTEVICYGIGFYKKQVQVRVKRKKI